MQPDNEDEAWRAIVENYGARPDLDPADPLGPADPRGPADPGAPHGPADRVDPVPPAWAVPPTRDTSRPDDERFVPPAPPPVPRTTPDRLAAWAGLFGAPLVLLVALVLGRALPTWAGYLLVAWFVGGFLYLVVQMPSGPRDPGDDGARL